MRALCLLALAARAAALYEPMRSEVGLVSAANWMSQVVQNRQNGNVLLLHFFDAADAAGRAFAAQFEASARQHKGAFFFGQVDCRRNAALCAREGVARPPTLRLYPPAPLPAEDLALDVEAALRRAEPHLVAHITDVDDDNAAAFLQSEATLPKVLYFGTEAAAPLLLRALAHNFRGKLSFALVRAEAREVARQQGVKGAPAMLVLKSGQAPARFAKDFTYKAAFEFLNYFSEQFVPSLAARPSETRPWLFEAVPELTAKSAADLCLGLEKVLCVVLLSAGRPPKAQLDALQALKADFDTKLDRAAAYKFMWMDAARNAEWAARLGAGGVAGATVRVLNPGRRKRFVALEEEFSREAVARLLEKIAGGDARFVPLNAELPPFAEEL